VLEEGEYVVEPFEPDGEWHRFLFGFETDNVRIDYFEEYIIFNPDDTPQKCVKIYLSDGSFIHGRYSFESFEKLYNEQYIPLIPKNLAQIVEDLKDMED